MMWYFHPPRVTHLGHPPILTMDVEISDAIGFVRVDYPPFDSIATVHLPNHEENG